MFKLKKLIRAVFFVVIFIILFNGVFKVLWLDKNSIGYFYDEPKNSLDIVYIGASNVHYHFNSLLAYNLYGYTTGLMSSGGQSFLGTLNLIKEAERLQNPELYIIDLTNAYHFNFYEGDVRKLIDSIPFSSNRTMLVSNILQHSGVKKEDYINYYFSYLVYHNRWKDISKINFVGDSKIYKGFYLNPLSVSTESFSSSFLWDNSKEKISDDVKRVLDDLITYIKENNLNVLFVVPIRFNSGMIKLNTVISLLEENDFLVINFNKVKELNIDYQNDFYNKEHLNVYGSTKYTLYFAKYLKEHYDLLDHRDDKKYVSWNKEYERFKNDFNLLTKKDYDSLLLEYQNI